MCLNTDWYIMSLVFFFFFFKQKTAYEIYQCDWSSDVCSSDLWVMERFAGRISEIAQHRGGAGALNVRIEIGSQRPRAPTRPAPAEAPPNNSPSRQGQGYFGRLNPEFNFDTHVQGNSNQLARGAAQQVAEDPAHAYNPLYIYGGVGLGKTHLMQAAGNLLRERKANIQVAYVHAERFVAEMVKALQQNTITEFKRHYRSLDVLLIDDVQFFAGKGHSQEEFFHTFNTLVEGERQIIMTSDRFPKEISGVGERLRSRFGSGLTVAIEPPELETRVAILHRKAVSQNVTLPEDVAFFIAKCVRANVRDLEGALHRVLASSRFSGRPIDIGLATEALKDLLLFQERQVTINNIQKTVAEYFNMRVSDLHSKRRTRQVARPRQLAMAVAKKLTSLSLPEIGDAFGGRDHTTVLHACRKIAELCQQDPRVKEDYENLLRSLTG